MSMSISNVYTPFFQRISMQKNSDRPNADAAIIYANKNSDTVHFSKEGCLRVSELLNGLILPAEENVRKLSGKLSQDLKELLNGLVDCGPLEFTVDGSGEIRITGDRRDKMLILEAIDGNEQVKEEIRTTAAIASHAAGFAESMKFQKEYRASNNPESVVARYSYLFGPAPRSHQISLVYDGDNVNVLQAPRNA